MKFKEIIDHFKNNGESKNQPDSKYDQEQLKKGVEVEYEHSPVKEIAKEIAKDHLEEFPDYYSRLLHMEKTAKADLANLGREEYIKRFLRREK